MVRNLWEQIGFVRDQLTNWEQPDRAHRPPQGLQQPLQHLLRDPEEEQTRNRNEKALALLLAYILPVPVMLVASNRRSTGVGVRPRGGRIEVTVDFTPDPGLMIASATLIVGIVREVMTWPSYDLALLEKLPIPIVARRRARQAHHAQRMADERLPLSAEPLHRRTSTRRSGRRSSATKRSLRADRRSDTAWFFRHSIRKYSDPFSFRLLFAVLDGRAPSLLELVDRPDRVRRRRPALPLGKRHPRAQELRSRDGPARAVHAWKGQSIDQYVLDRQQAREKHQTEMANVTASQPRARTPRSMPQAAGPAPKPPPRTSSTTSVPVHCRERRGAPRAESATVATPQRQARKAHAQAAITLSSNAAACRSSATTAADVRPSSAAGPSGGSATTPSRSPIAVWRAPRTSRSSSSSSPAAGCAWATISTPPSP